MKIINEMKKKLHLERAREEMEEIKKDAEMILNKLIYARPLKFTKHFEHRRKATEGVDQEEEELRESNLEASEEAFLVSVVENHSDFVLSNLEASEIQRLVRAMEKHTAAAGDVLIQQGDTGDYLYVVREGTVRILVDGEDKGTASEGAVVGELALLYDCPRAATVRADTDCVLYRVSQETFRRIQASFILSNDDETRTLLKKSTLFANLHDDLIREMASYMFQKKFTKGQILVEKGQDVDEIYFVKRGTILGRDVSARGVEYADITLEPGGTFGDHAVLMNHPAFATVECLTDGVVYVLTKERFFTCLKGIDLHEMVQRNADSQILHLLPFFAYADIDDVEIREMVKKMEHVTLEPGDTLATLGEEVEPALYVVMTRSKDHGYLQSTKDGVVIRDVRAGEAMGFGKATINISNISQSESCEAAALYGSKEGLVELDTTDAIKESKHNMLVHNKVVSQFTVVARGTGTVHLKKLTLKDLSKIIHDPFRLGKDYRVNGSKKTEVTTDVLQRKQLLGQGTFGQVWLCREKRKGDPYALKIQYKRELIQQHQADGVIRETHILQKMHHPFVAGLVNAQQDVSCLYLVMPLVPGGELRQQMRSSTRPYLEEPKAKFYAACLLEGLGYMHRRKYIYRDLKGENVMLDREGYCVIIDFGFAKYVPDKTFTFCGTPIFIAPEVVLNKGHDKSADIWSLGVMIFEMLMGTNPFFDYNDPTIDQRKLFNRIVRGQIQVPRQQASIDAFDRLSDDAKDLIKKLLVVNVRDRLGCMANADLDIRNHPWFANEKTGIDFGKLYRKEIPAPWVPVLSDPFDSTNFKHTSARSKKGLKPLTTEEQKLFEDFC